MAILSTLTAALCCAVGTLAIANPPPIPKDRTTPVQQRLAFHDPTGEFVSSSAISLLSHASHSCIDWMEHIPADVPTLCQLRHFSEFIGQENMLVQLHHLSHFSDLVQLCDAEKLEARYYVLL